ncbi:MAG: phosphoribosylformylglycinamidine cyclo-ligase [Candidatus Omnitrophica bacterium]|nr:phosphoribosylformylglycinamidine cyclo-ligase [Candidatus Omnitrophota bacterium]
MTAHSTQHTAHRRGLRLGAQGSGHLPTAQNPQPRTKSITYRASGVNIAAADGWLSRMRPLIRTTTRPGVLPDRGQFAGLFHLAATKLRDPILVASTDGVGTKLAIARSVRDHETIGIDAVAMNTNDILVYGAQPLFFLDYLAVGKIQPALMSAIVRGVVEGCRQSGCVLLGGETAEMPGIYKAGEYDIAGFCVGAVEHGRLIDGSKVRAGDVIVGLASSGVHANGFSLVRRALSRAELRHWHLQLMAPTRIYVKPVLEVLNQVSIHAMAHVTGGGLARRIPSLVSRAKGLRTRLWPGSWRVPPIFRAIQAAGRISDAEMTRTFNMGIGMALACATADATCILRMMARAGIPAWTIGTIERTRS